jgi:metal-sulfur cluster biosynthetic enzyme
MSSSSSLINENPTVYSVSEVHRSDADARLRYDDGVPDPFDPLEVFEMIRTIMDPEHPLTLEQLQVARLADIHVDNEAGTVVVYFTPTVTHCSMSTLIGLSIRVKLLRSLPSRFKIEVFIKPGTHSSEESVNKQLHDKERCAAALENANLLSVINQCIG